MTNETTILFDISDGVARLTLNRPDRLNAFNVPMHEAVMEALDKTVRAADVRVLLFTGAGRGFCAGQDLAERNVEDDTPLDLGYNIKTYYNPLARKLLALPFPVVCAVNGVAAGAGANIALLCDLVIAKKSARFIQSFAKIGLLPDSGGTWTLPHILGEARALGLALTGEALDAERAAEWGMIWKAVDDILFDAEVETLLLNLAKAPTLGLVATKRAIRQAWTNTIQQQFDLECQEQRRLGRSDDYREGVTAFKAKRPPLFRGR